MTNQLRKEDILALYFHLTEVEADACVKTIESDIEAYAEFGQGYLMAIKTGRDILKRIIKDM